MSAPIGRAAAMRSTRVDGLRETDAALAALPPALNDMARGAIARGAELIEREARQRAPYKTGRLVRSITTNTREDGLMAAVGSPLPHARWLELGTKKMPARPYLFPAFKRGARLVRREMREGMAEIGNKARFKTRRFKAKAE